MRLKSVKLAHFRGYRATTVTPIDEAMTGPMALSEASRVTGEQQPFRSCM